MKREYLLSLLIFLTAFIFIVRLFFLQVFGNPSENNFLRGSTIKKKIERPERGYIFDRNDNLLVANKLYYDLMIIPKEVKNLDTIELCKLLNINKASFLKRSRKAKKWSPLLPSVFLANISKEDYAYIQEKMYKYKGFYTNKKSLRYYPIISAANVLGYVSENNSYSQLIGITGIEKQYDSLLRGYRGVKYMQRNRFNIITGPYKKGIYDTISKSGHNLTLSIDTELQQYGEKLMIGKRGGIVAIEPKTGEILSLISMPNYDPNLMVGRLRSKYSLLFFQDIINKPMYDRSLLAQYAPGSPFKLIQGLIGLQEEIITTETSFYCQYGYRYGMREKEFMSCHCGIVNSPIKLETAISKSCNSYFSNLYRRIIEKYPTASQGIDVWSKHVQSFGFGNYLGYDLPEGQKGLVPGARLYNKWYPDNRWSATYTISNAIGQGQILVTPIQLANMTAAIANRGFYYTPHLLKKINGKRILNRHKKIHFTSIDKKYFNPIIEGMHGVFKTGTAKHMDLKNIDLCGKTGTVENFKLIDEEKVKFEDHSVFVAFAPKNKPEIAISVYIENGGSGYRIAAPIATLMIEKYLTKKITHKYWEQKMFDTNLEGVYQKKLTKSKNQ